MHRPSGIVLILVGLSVAAYALAEPPASSMDGPGGQEAIARNPTIRSDASFSAPPQPVTPPVVSAESRPQPEPDAKIGASPATEPAATAAKRKDVLYRGTVVAKQSERTPMGQPLASSGRPLDRAALTRELQRQLQRVGCYGGSISGIWTPSTRQAMKEFTERVNATLPIAEPDHILLALLQSHGEQACGQGCRAGQNRSNDGTCQPNTIIVRDATKHKAGTHGLTAALPPAPNKLDVTGVHLPGADVEATAGTDQPLAGRMALAGPEQGAALPPADPPAVQPGTENRTNAAQLKERAAGTQKYVPSRRRQMGAWIFHDAPADRLLAR